MGGGVVFVVWFEFGCLFFFLRLIWIGVLCWSRILCLGVSRFGVFVFCFGFVVMCGDVKGVLFIVRWCVVLRCNEL